MSDPKGHPPVKPASKYESLEPLDRTPEFCEVCALEIQTMSFKGTGVCSDLHMKERAKRT